MGLFGALKKLLDPQGPIGEWLSPSEVYKQRLGLPISSPNTMRATVSAPQAEVEKALSPSRFIALSEAVDVPKSRVRQVSAFVEEHWSPVYQTTESIDPWEIVKASQTQIGWKVTQRQTVASRPRPSAEEFIEIAQRCQIQATDEFYNGLIETVPGNDPVIFDGQLLRGEPSYEILPDGSRGKMLHDGIIRGTMITHGRREYNERTKGFAHWDAGFIEKRKAALAEEDSRPVRNVQRALEATAGACLPMHKPVGLNFRRDRRSDV